MTIIQLIIFLIIFLNVLIFFIIINNQRKKIKHLESILFYYKWHDALFEEPTCTGNYLTQTKNKENKISINKYDIEKRMWVSIDEKNIVAWCRLPNFLYPEKNSFIPYKV